MLCIGYGREAAARRMRGLSPRIETPHPALRATFSHKGRRKKKPPALRFSNLIQRNDARAICPSLEPLELPKGTVP